MRVCVFKEINTRHLHIIIFVKCCWIVDRNLGDNMACVMLDRMMAGRKWDFDVHYCIFHEKCFVIIAIYL
jgi:hypothetical protein